jgi:hypothetical protein
MNTLRDLMVMLFIATLSNTAFANQGDDKNKDMDGTQGTIEKPDCEYTSASEYL